MSSVGQTSVQSSMYGFVVLYVNVKSEIPQQQGPSAQELYERSRKLFLRKLSLQLSGS